MRFLVPQFIDVEPKVMGPITVRQFVTCIAGGLFIFITYRLSDFSLFILLGILEVVIFGTIAFVKVNGQPFHLFLLNVLITYKRPAARIWKKEEMKEVEGKEKGEKTEDKIAIIPRQALPPSRLSELSMVVNTGGAYQEEEEE